MNQSREDISRYARHIFGVPLLLIRWITWTTFLTRHVLYAMIMESNRYQSHMMNIIILNIQRLEELC
jgi:hypothetical protein